MAASGLRFWPYALGSPRWLPLSPHPPTPHTTPRPHTPPVPHSCTPPPSPLKPPPAPAPLLLLLHNVKTTEDACRLPWSGRGGS